MAKRTGANLFLIGDSPLVEELGAIFERSGLTVTGKLNGRTKPSRPVAFLRGGTAVPRAAECCFELTLSDVERKRRNLQFLDKHAGPGCTIASSSVILTASDQSGWVKNPRRLVGMSALPTLMAQKLVEIAPTRDTDEEHVKRVVDLYARAGMETAIVQDRVGMVMPRILCALVNEALFALTENVATPGDIDAAMKLGTNYPFGPVEWGDRIGFKNVLNILNALYDDLHEERYRAAPLLRKLASGTRWWNT